MEKMNWKKYLVLVSVFFVSLFILAFLNQTKAEAGTEEFVPEHGIPLMIIRIDESAEGINIAKENDPDHEYGTIKQMNDSGDHSVRCIGTTELKVPEGYSGGYGSLPYELTTGELKLEYIRGRGNGSWFGAKKPYKIKLDKKQDFLGMGKSKEWALLAERMDPTLMKNRISFDMGRKMGLNYTPQLVPVEVVMIGSKSGAEYLGVFNLAETIKLEKSRIDLSEPGKDATEEEGENNITGSYIVSFYNAFRDIGEPKSNRFFTDVLNGTYGFLNKEPEYESEDLTEAEKKQRAYIRQYINDTEKLIMSSNYIDHDLHMQIDERMDLKSAADYWWVTLFARNTDGYYTSSTYMYKEKDGKLYWGPLWDFDVAYGRAFMATSGVFTNGFGEVNPFPWITQLRKSDPEFVKLLKERWHALDGLLDEFVKEGGLLDQYKNEVALAQEADYKKWSSVPGLTFYYAVKDYDRAVEKLRTFIEKRRAWINANLDSVGSFLTVSFDSGEGEGSMEDIINLQEGRKMQLPACGFSPKEGSCKAFDYWQINGQKYQAGETVVIKKDTAVTAVWKTEHTWKDANCTEPRTCAVCGKTEGEPLGHNWDNGKVTKKPTCKDCGERTFSCRNCNETISVPVDRVAHEFKKDTTPATLSKNGSVVVSCKFCGKVKSKTTVYRPKSFALESSGYVYNGSRRTPAVKVTDTKGKIIAASNYTLKYTNNKNVGDASVTIRFKGKYSGEKKLNFRIVPRSTSISKVTPGAKSFTVYWKKQSTQTTGYEIQYSTTKDFKSGNQTVKVTSNAATSKRIAQLKENKTYYVRIRTYKTAEGKKYYSGWSKTKSVKMK
ncbi:MAG: CotH kinase family protein [Parasporobacterium sp.]|nr:CotH kinase family protein [Parasporobacterium sp.]